MKHSRYLGEGILVILLMILILLLMIKGTVNAQTIDLLTNTNYMYALPFTSEAPPVSLEGQRRVVKTNFEDNLKIFVLDETMMVEMMKQDEKIATMMIAAVVRAIGYDVKLCEMIRWDIAEADSEANVATFEEVPKVIPSMPKGDLYRSTNCTIHNKGKTCTCDCKCCKNPKS